MLTLNHGFQLQTGVTKAEFYHLFSMVLTGSTQDGNQCQ